MSEKKDCCHIDITINSKGDVNIYNCPPASTPPPDAPCDREPAPVCPGACVPLAIGTKPKQSQRRKLDKLLAQNHGIPSAFAGAFVHLTRRFLANRPPANALEHSAFDRLGALSPDLRRVLQCALDQFDDLDPAERAQLFETQAFGDVTTPVDIARLAGAVSSEAGQRAALLTFGDPGCLIEEPGRIRVFDPGTAEFFDHFVRICRVNGLRTVQHRPMPPIGDYLPEELQQQCTPTVVNGELQVSCSIQRHNCPGHTWPDDGTCFRVPEIEAGQTVLLEGVNFFSVDAVVRLIAKGSGEVGRVVDAHVCGDLQTPVTETIEGVERVILDCRVNDRLTFTVPADLVPGIYEIYVEVPNITSVPSLGPVLTSSVEYIAVLLPANARFEIVAERLVAHQETSPAFLGSDEVGVRFLSAGLGADGTWGQLHHVESIQGNVDSGADRSMNCTLLRADDQPFTALAISVLGYEIDNYPTYLAQVQGLTDAYVDVLSRVWKAEVAGVVLFAALAIPGGPLAVAVVAAIAIAVMAAVNFFIALWAPADLIMQDVIFLTATQLAALTSDQFGLPAGNEYVSAADIKVKVLPESKGGNEFVEVRDYTCSDEESRYAISLRYRRTA